ncbi:deoxyribonuclease [Ammoniphilus oxalaticus]|uniref:Deoxyribonuclease n=1 Tax=Ammoniphilus oxalaticus TaxID=66863 RepID=A0A419SLW4_9BACL|nr:TatD family hydrolase [Ammoniphilus oxalaticus]RKD25048.1 deoxyribonuclease [Ammoniphilus oxalaticus]
MRGYIDAHLHLDQYPPAQLAALVDQWQHAGIAGVMAVSSDLASAYRTLELREKYPTFVFIALGIHPEQPLPCERDQQELFSLLRGERNVISAIGEVGLPHYIYQEQTMSAPPAFADALKLLEQFCLLSNELDLPMLLHAVHERAQVAFDLLQKYNIARAHFHWLKAPAATVDQLLRAGYFISVTPEVCYRERDQQLLARVPLNQLLIETDGPWPFQGPFEGQSTTPLFLKEVANHVAHQKGIPLETVINTTAQNVLNLIGPCRVGGIG